MVCQKTFKLNNGHEIPAVGLGTWQASEQDDTVYKSIKAAIAAGYRHIDTAMMYGNEAEVGRGIRDGLKENGLERKDIFVTTKLATIDARPSYVPKALDDSLARLGLDYIDLYLMHWPIAMNPTTRQLIPLRPDGTRDIDEELQGKFELTYEAMEKLLDTGKVKSIGVANFSIPNLERLLKTAKVVPAVNQIELHPYLPQFKLVDYCTSKGIHCSAYSPLGSSQSTLFQNETLVKIAKAHHASVAQILISWGITRTSVLPKSVNPERIASNIETVTLSEDEMNDINNISKTTTKRFIRPAWGVPVFDEDFE
ncbi:NADP-dependent oxidoreductase domain-containing protein [Cokeromyces recurvatus]|uniref:NADP-dependent oxidoreductase domain-containing protein n=1 Tax=Cokeromyces recurvatus TaxID=90255 RepID=UPI00221E8F47|nr:NADP-dependent oxidoreductase domain-containing protein [Cokeromyces recurvatus]KAI7901063.1 NADP-dependent oxidoreductase domain-containing protein [Cokeromyces recurvatus]